MTEPRPCDGYKGVPQLDLAKAPEGQGFIIHPWAQPDSIFGIVDDPEFPIVTMRLNAMGAPVHRFLQVPGVKDKPSEADLPIVNRYYRATRGEAEAALIPASLLIGHVAHFMAIDQNGEAIMPDEHTVSIDAIKVGSIQLAKPLVEGMVAPRPVLSPAFEALLNAE